MFVGLTLAPVWQEEPVAERMQKSQRGTGIGQKYIVSILEVNEAGNSISEGSEAVG